MRTRCDSARARVAVVTALSMFISPVAPLLRAQAPAAQATAPAAGQPAKTPAAPTTPATPATASPAPNTLAGAAAAAGKPGTTTATQAPVDGGWPRAYATPSNGHVLVYQPQVASWEGQKHMVAYAAVSYQVAGAEKPALGSVRIEGDTKVAMSERLVRFSSMMLKEASFPTLPKDNLREVTAEIEKAIPDDERVIALDRVLAGLDKSQILPKNAEGVKADPPKIFYSEKPAVLVNLDGEAIWSPIRENDLKFAVNTNWDLFQHEPTKTFGALSAASF